VNPLFFPLLADENIDPTVVAGLCSRGHDVCRTGETGLNGRSDLEVLRTATAGGRVVITHDAGFASAAIRGGEPFVGIVCLRPGHIVAKTVLDAMLALSRVDIDVEPPFFVVVERREGRVKIRLRAGGPW
jgi:predicted nuclease of predicted toxin-antitoxin system